MSERSVPNQEEQPPPTDNRSSNSDPTGHRETASGGQGRMDNRNDGRFSAPDARAQDNSTGMAGSTRGQNAESRINDPHDVRRAHGSLPQSRQTRPTAGTFRNVSARDDSIGADWDQLYNNQYYRTYTHDFTPLPPDDHGSPSTSGTVRQNIGREPAMAPAGLPPPGRFSTSSTRRQISEEINRHARDSPQLLQQQQSQQRLHPTQMQSHRSGQWGSETFVVDPPALSPPVVSTTSRRTMSNEDSLNEEHPVRDIPTFIPDTSIPTRTDDNTQERSSNDTKIRVSTTESIVQQSGPDDRKGGSVAFESLDGSNKKSDERSSTKVPAPAPTPIGQRSSRRNTPIIIDPLPSNVNDLPGSVTSPENTHNEKSPPKGQPGGAPTTTANKPEHPKTDKPEKKTFGPQRPTSDPRTVNVGSSGRYDHQTETIGILDDELQAVHSQNEYVGVYFTKFKSSEAMPRVYCDGHLYSLSPENRREMLPIPRNFEISLFPNETHQPGVVTAGFYKYCSDERLIHAAVTRQSQRFSDLPGNYVDLIIRRQKKDAQRAYELHQKSKETPKEKRSVPKGGAKQKYGIRMPLEQTLGPKAQRARYAEERRETPAHNTRTFVPTRQQRNVPIPLNIEMDVSSAHFENTNQDIELELDRTQSLSLRHSNQSVSSSSHARLNSPNDSSTSPARTFIIFGKDGNGTGNSSDDKDKKYASQQSKDYTKTSRSSPQTSASSRVTPKDSDRTVSSFDGKTFIVPSPQGSRFFKQPNDSSDASSSDNKKQKKDSKKESASNERRSRSSSLPRRSMDFDTFEKNLMAIADDIRENVLNRNRKRSRQRSRSCVPIAIPSFYAPSDDEPSDLRGPRPPIFPIRPLPNPSTSSNASRHKSHEVGKANASHTHELSRKVKVEKCTNTGPSLLGSTRATKSEKQVGEDKAVGTGVSLLGENPQLHTQRPNTQAMPRPRQQGGLSLHELSRPLQHVPRRELYDAYLEREHQAAMGTLSLSGTPPVIVQLRQFVDQLWPRQYTDDVIKSRRKKLAMAFLVTQQLYWTKLENTLMFDFYQHWSSAVNSGNAYAIRDALQMEKWQKENREMFQLYEYYLVLHIYN